MERKLATIRTISGIRPIENADKILCATVDGWEVVISKKDGFKVGDKIIYIEIDSIVPPKPEFEFLKDRKYRVRTIKLRGQISQGLIMPLSILPPGERKEYDVGDDVTDIIGVKKYDPEVEVERKSANSAKTTKKPKTVLGKWLMRLPWFRDLYYQKEDTSFPYWISKTDEERIQNLPKLFDTIKERHIPLSVTEKVDGCSATYYLKKKEKPKFWESKYEFGVCSRNLRIPKDNGSYYWRIANDYQIENVLYQIIGNCDFVVLQGEITGKGIQGNKYPLGDKYSFWAFNLITPCRKYTTSEMQKILAPLGVYCVPIAMENFYIGENWTIQDLVNTTKGKSQIVNRQREGFVFRNISEIISFKAINPDFLIENED